MSDDKTDYTPLPRRGGEERRSTPPAPRKPAPRPQEQADDYTPRPARREQSAAAERAPAPRPARREREACVRPASRAPRGRRSAKRGNFLRSRGFLVLACVAGLVVLVGVPVLADLIQQQPASSFEALVQAGNQYYDQGMELANAGNQAQALSSFEQAAQEYEEALKMQPADTNVRTDLGTMYRYQGMLRGDQTLIAKAIQTWIDVLTLEPDKPEALFNLGLAYSDLGQVDQATAMWQRVIAVAPGSPVAQEAQNLLDQYSQQGPW
jgi:tetratricopeptide (TPR) repeat protein